MKEIVNQAYLYKRSFTFVLIKAVRNIIKELSDPHFLKLFNGGVY